MSIERDVKLIVESRGYGPWYQYVAWNHVKNMRYDDIIGLFFYLDYNYPKLEGN